jgi:hypothetical protein
MDKGGDSDAPSKSPDSLIGRQNEDTQSQERNRVICAERERLLQTVKEAVNEHSQGVSALVDIIEAESSNCKKAIPVRERITIAGSKVKVAWDAYHQHLREHDC